MLVSNYALFVATAVAALLWLETVATAFSAPVPRKTLEVCLSPGCIADSARATLDQMQALAPPGVEVKPGVCCSLCGNGPIVMCQQEKATKKTRRVSGQKLLELLTDANGGDDLPPTLIKGYEQSLKAEEAFVKKDYQSAVSMYETVIETAFRPAMDLQAAREKAQVDNKDENGIPVGLLWLVKARRNEASSKLALGDIEGAVFAAQASCNLSRDRCPESLEVLASVYQTQGDVIQELHALTDLFALPVDDSKLPAPVKNRRRELGFRRASLEKQV